MIIPPTIYRADVADQRRAADPRSRLLGIAIDDLRKRTDNGERDGQNEYGHQNLLDPPPIRRAPRQRGNGNDCGNQPHPQNRFAAQHIHHDVVVDVRRLRCKGFQSGNKKAADKETRQDGKEDENDRLEVGGNGSRQFAEQRYIQVIKGLKQFIHNKGLDGTNEARTHGSGSTRDAASSPKGYGTDGSSANAGDGEHFAEKKRAHPRAPCNLPSRYPPLLLFLYFPAVVQTPILR